MTHQDGSLAPSMLARLTRLFIPQYTPPREPTKDVAIVVPAPGRPGLTEDQKISLAALQRHLPGYDHFLITPQGSNRGVDGMTSIEFPLKYFGSVGAHNRMLFSPSFFLRFCDYRYILLYHLDSLVLRDELKDWCETGYDYIGAPWFPSGELPWVKEPHVGNGGFTLMNVASCIRVLRRRYEENPIAFWEHHVFQPTKRAARWCTQKLEKLPTLLARLLTKPTKAVTKYFDRFTLNERNNDRFWSLEATELDPSFKIPDWKTGLRFAFEADPKKCFQLNEQHLPFGCHAWQRFDKEFWLEHIV